ncbi:DNA adenine methylase [Leuconostoc falkenbergense]|uniref:DNA adenine methylase n=1 Tax=Leuconostoc falkenbergense TaxID=2766470 RepID=UPI0024AE2D52|nr:DNA adenine methylase [Leuconostoc falkenbergense]MDI6666652.1 DNA adenine methylase [Leuconostoc falkenbergense]
MRYLGNKTRLVGHINQLIEDKHISGGVFADLFTGTGSVADHLKDRFEIITNDLLRYASLFSAAKINYSETPNFPKFKKKFKQSPFDFWNTYDYSKEPDGFVTLNFSPKGDRKFFQEKNAIKIDTIRRQLDVFQEEGVLSDSEWTYLLASLLESIMGVSNTSGTYEAFFKDWESRSKKDLMIEPLSMENLPLFSKHNVTYNDDSNELVRHIQGDVAYIDTPYTVTQYASAYHVLETIALNDSPKITGKTGRRVERKMSDYSKRYAAKTAFEDLIRQLRFTHVIISYSNQSLIPLEELTDLIKRFAVNGEVEVRSIDFREYKNLNISQKGDGKKLQEVLIYFKKDFKIIKSPLNYAGSKDLIMDKITAALPSHISNFVDMTGGAFNVGINIVGTGKTFYNEKNPVVFELVQRLLQDQPVNIINRAQKIVDRYNLSKSNKNAYLRLREHYNSVPFGQRDPMELFVLTLYSFQHMIRFNKSGGFNVPVGNSGITEDVISRVNNYHTKMPLGNMTLGSFTDVNMNEFDEDTLFYFDPPYIITSAAYNDGKRLEAEWTEHDEYQLLNYLENLDKSGRKFLLSNTVVHKGQSNEILLDWVIRHDFEMQNVGGGGRRYPRLEVLIKNY